MTAAQAKTMADLVFKQTTEWKEVEQQILEACQKGHCVVTVKTSSWRPGYSKRIQYLLRDEGFILTAACKISELEISWNVKTS